MSKANFIMRVTSFMLSSPARLPRILGEIKMKLYEINEIDNILKNIKKCQDLIDKAPEVFDSGSAGRDKRLIIDLFKITNGQHEEHIKLRLYAIKELYGVVISEQGIEALSSKIDEESNKKGEADIKERFRSFFCLHNHEKGLVCDEGIYEIIYNEREKYKDKEGKEKKKKTVSLSTKYAYFLTEQKFPIYDRFVVKMLITLSDAIVNPFVQGKKIYGPAVMPDNFFEAMYKISNKIGDNKIGTGVDRFDAFCWTWGKIAESEDGVVGVFDKYQSQKFDKKLKNENVKLIRPMDDKEKEQKKGKKKEKKIEKIIKLADCSQELADIIGSL